MADWPGEDELKQVLNVDSEDWDDTLTRVLNAAIWKVKSDVGRWDELVDTPDDNLSQAALRMGELIAERPTGPLTRGLLSSLGRDPTYATLLSGHRRRFPIG